MKTTLETTKMYNEWMIYIYNLRYQLVEPVATGNTKPAEINLLRDQLYFEYHKK